MLSATREDVLRYFAYLLALSGCCISSESMEAMPFIQDGPAYTSPLNPGLRFEAKPRESLLARSTFGFPEPAKGIVGSQCDDIEDGGPVSGSGLLDVGDQVRRDHHRPYGGRQQEL